MVNFDPLKEGVYTATAGGQTKTRTVVSDDLNDEVTISFNIASSSVNTVILSYGGEEVARQTVTRNPTTISVGDVTSTSIEILWKTRDNAFDYSVYRNDELQANRHLTYSDPRTSVINTGLTPGTTYEYYVGALYDNPLSRVNSNTLIVTTSAPDTEKPVITVNEESFSIELGETYTPFTYFATDDTDGDITGGVIVDGDTVDINVANTYTVTFDVADAAGNLAETVTRTVTVTDTTAPDTTPPVEDPFVISVGAVTDTTISLSWNTVTDATYYKVYRDNRQQGGNIAGTTYTDTVFPGTTYKYHVIAFDGDGVITTSNVESATSTGTALTTPPAAPVLSVDRTLDAIILLSWTAVSNADSYTLTRIVDGGNDVIVLSGTSGLSTGDTGLLSGTAYKYFVTATNTFGESVRSNTVTTTTTGTAPDTTPPVITVTPEEITLELNSPAPELTTGVRTDDGSEITISGTVDVGTVGDYTITYSSTDGTNPAVDKTRIYKVTAAPLETPALTLASFTDTRITLFWGAVDNANSYTLTRIVGTETSEIPDITDTFYDDENLEPETNYKYTITATNTAGTSVDSNEVTATTLVATTTTYTSDQTAIEADSFSVYVVLSLDQVFVEFDPRHLGEYSVVLDGVTKTIAVTNDNIDDRVTIVFDHVDSYVGNAVLSFGGEDVVRQTVTTEVKPAIEAGSFEVTIPIGTNDLLVEFVALKAGTFTITAGTLIDTVDVTDTDVTDEIVKSKQIPVNHEFDGNVILSFDDATVASTPASLLAIRAGTFSYTGDAAGDVTVSFVPLRAGTFLVEAGDASDDIVVATGDIGNTVSSDPLSLGNGFSSDILILLNGDVYLRPLVVTLPGIPTLEAETPTHNSVTLSWNKIASATGYILSRTGGTGSTEIPVAGTEISYTDDTLEPETTYTYSIRAVAAAGDSADSSVVSVTTLAATTPTEPFVTVTRPTTDSITVTWGNIPGTDYNIYAINEGEDPDSIAELVTSPHTITKDDPSFNKANSAEEIGVFGFSEGNPVGGAVDNNNITSEEVPPVDTTPPPVPAITTPSATVGASPITIDGGSTEAGATITLFNGMTSAGTVTADGSGDFSFAGVELDEGANSFTARASDGVNTSAASPAIVITLDTEKPVITVLGSSETIELTTTDTYTIPDATVEDNDPAYSGTVTITDDAPNSSVIGVYTVLYDAPADTAGNTPDQQSITITVSDTTPPTFDVDGNTVDYTTTVPFGGTYAPGVIANESDISGIASSIVVGDDLVNVNTSGEYTVTYTVTDNNGLFAIITETVTVASDVAAPPTIDAVRNADNSVTVSWSNIETSITNNYVLIISDGSSDFDTFTPSDGSNQHTIRITHIIDLNDANRVCIKGVAVDNEICEPVPEAFDITAPSITVNEESFSVELGEEYTPFTFTATDNTDGVITDDVVVGDTVDTSTIGTYDVTFDVVDAAGNHAVTVTRTVTVTATAAPTPPDTTPPVITVDPLTVTLQADSLQPDLLKGVSADDGSTVTTTGNVDVNTQGDYDITYDSVDASDNAAESVTRTYTVPAQNPDDSDSGDGVITGTDTPKKKGGDSNEWKTKPTFGKHWNNQAVQLVDDGFVFNGMPLTITNNWHTDFNLTSSIIGDNNTVHIKGYATNGLKSVSLSLGVPEIGLKTNAESHIIVNVNSNYTSPAGYDIADIVHEQKEELVNEKMTGASIDKVKCISSDTAERCFDVTISFVIMAPLSHEVLAINAVDKQRYSTTTYINEGVEFTGEALLAAATHELKQKHGNQNPFETISLTQQDRRYQVWEDQYGYIWSQNDYGTWLQITRPDIQQRDDLPTSVMTRIHSNFANLVIDEQDRATLIFDSKAIQGTLDESFSYDMPLRLDRVSDPALLESLSIQEMLAQEMLCDCMIYDDSDLSWND